MVVSDDGDRPDPHRRVRTFHARHGRVTDRMRHVIAEIGPRFAMSQRHDPTRPVVVEVGCGFGDAAVAYADHRPDVDVIAFDIHTPGIVATLEAAAHRHNLYVERADAVERLEVTFAAASVAAIHVFFPDPWPKARHNKRRFIRPDILDLCASRLVDGGELAFATDVDDYARWAIEHLDAHDAFDGGVVERPGWRPVTRYEAQGRAAGRSVTDLSYRRRRR